MELLSLGVAPLKVTQMAKITRHPAEAVEIVLKRPITNGQPASEDVFGLLVSSIAGRRLAVPVQRLGFGQQITLCMGCLGMGPQDET